jgi:hypothetical protein
LSGTVFSASWQRAKRLDSGIPRTWWENFSAMRTIWCALLRVARTNPIFVQSSIRIGIGACLKELKRYSVCLKWTAGAGLSGFGVARPGQLWANPRNRFSRGCVAGMATSHNLTRPMSPVCSGFQRHFCHESIPRPQATFTGRPCRRRAVSNCWNSLAP